jgi:helicase required for RNAi-mediated heterochromatin assembly 1
MDLSVLSGSEEDSLQLQNVNVLEKFPEIPSSGMDSSQMLACERMLTKRIAIVQGPPGTGKTFVSVSALRAMLANLAPHDPPILVAAQTNHALDQLLNHVLSHEPNILRLGGRCDKDNKQILKRTLFELRRTTKHLPSGCKGNKGYGKLKARVEEIKTAMKPLLDDKLLTAETLLHDGLITKEQYDSLFADAGWQIGDDSGRKGLEKCKTFQFS